MFMCVRGESQRKCVGVLMEGGSVPEELSWTPNPHFLAPEMMPVGPSIKVKKARSASAARAPQRERRNGYLKPVFRVQINVSTGFQISYHSAATVSICHMSGPFQLELQMYALTSEED